MYGLIMFTQPATKPARLFTKPATKPATLIMAEEGGREIVYYAQQFCTFHIQH